MQINLTFPIGTEVEILPFKISGTVIQIWSDGTRVEYRVRFFWETKVEEIYFRENELKHK